MKWLKNWIRSAAGTEDLRSQLDGANRSINRLDRRITELSDKIDVISAMFLQSQREVLAWRERSIQSENKVELLQTIMSESLRKPEAKKRTK